MRRHITLVEVGGRYSNSLGICKRFSATVNCSVARQPLRGRHRGARRAVPLLLTSLERRHAPIEQGISAAALAFERSSLSPAIRHLRERWPLTRAFSRPLVGNCSRFDGKDSNTAGVLRKPTAVCRIFLNRGSQVRFLPRAR